MRILRHFESSDNAIGGVLNDGDPSLSERGRRQAELTAGFLALEGVELFLCSPATRALQSMEAINMQLDHPAPVIVRPGLTELHWGAGAAGRRVADIFSTDEVKARALEEDIHYRLLPDSETFAEVHERMHAALDDYADAPDSVVVVSHSMSVKSLVGVDLGERRAKLLEREIKNGEVIDYQLSQPANPVSLYRPDVS